MRARDRFNFLIGQKISLPKNAGSRRTRNLKLSYIVNAEFFEIQELVYIYYCKKLAVMGRTYYNGMYFECGFYIRDLLQKNSSSKN